MAIYADSQWGMWGVGGWVAAGFGAKGNNHPLEKISIAMACERAGVKTVYPGADYMTGSRSGGSAALVIGEDGGLATGRGRF